MLNPRAAVWTAVAIYACVVIATVLDERTMVLPLIVPAGAVLLAVAWVSFRGIWRVLAAAGAMGVLIGGDGELASAAPRAMAWMLFAWVSLIWLALVSGASRTP